MKRFSKHELFRLRNSIDIKMLITQTLHIPSNTRQGYLRFLCPICFYHDTATKRETNLARCFRCERNFNTIEIVMAAKGLNFIESVRYLQNLLAENKHPVAAQVRRKAAAVDAIIKNIGMGNTTKLDENSDNDLERINQQETTIEELNSKINRLSKQLNQLKSFVTDQFVEKSKNQ